MGYKLLVTSIKVTILHAPPSESVSLRDPNTTERRATERIQSYTIQFLLTGARLKEKSVMTKLSTRPKRGG